MAHLATVLPSTLHPSPLPGDCPTEVHWGPWIGFRYGTGINHGQKGFLSSSWASAINVIQNVYQPGCWCMKGEQHVRQTQTRQSAIRARP